MSKNGKGVFDRRTFVASALASGSLAMLAGCGKKTGGGQRQRRK